MAVLDFPADTSQSPYEENGITYEWDGQKWIITSGGGSGGGGGGDLTLQEVTDNGNQTINQINIARGASAGYGLQITTDNSKGAGGSALTIENNLASGWFIDGRQNGDRKFHILANGGAFFGGTPTGNNISLGSDGTAVFAGTTSVYDGGTTTGKGVVAFDVGNGAGNKRFSVYPDGSLAIGGTGVHTDASILLNGPDGNAIFKSFVSVGESGGGTAAEGIYLSQLGRVITTGAVGGELWSGYEKDNASATSTIKADGSATFEGMVKLNADGPNSRGLSVQQAGVEHAYILSSGQALFDNTVTCRSTTNNQIVVMSKESFKNVQPTATDTESGFIQMAGGQLSSDVTARIFTSGNCKFKGVEFGDTGNTGIDTNRLLDDYEEGTWTPTYANHTVTAAEGYYTKVGRVVTVSCRIDYSAQVASPGSNPIGGFPFTSAVSANNSGIGLLGDCSNVNFPDGVQVIFRMNVNQNSGIMQMLQKDAASLSVTSRNDSNPGTINLAVTYMTDA